MKFKITVDDDHINIYDNIQDAAIGINDTLYKISGKCRENLETTLTELLTTDIFKKSLYSIGVKIPGTRLNDTIIVIKVQVI